MRALRLPVRSMLAALLLACLTGIAAQHEAVLHDDTHRDISQELNSKQPEPRNINEASYTFPTDYGNPPPVYGSEPSSSTSGTPICKFTSLFSPNPG